MVACKWDIFFVGCSRRTTTPASKPPATARSSSERHGDVYLWFRSDVTIYLVESWPYLRWAVVGLSGRLKLYSAVLSAVNFENFVWRKFARLAGAIDGSTLLFSG